MYYDTLPASDTCDFCLGAAGIKSAFQRRCMRWKFLASMPSLLEVSQVSIKILKQISSLGIYNESR